MHINDYGYLTFIYLLSRPPAIRLNFIASESYIIKYDQEISSVAYGKHNVIDTWFVIEDNKLVPYGSTNHGNYQKYYKPYEIT